MTGISDIQRGTNSHFADPLLVPYHWCAGQWEYFGSSIQAEQSCLYEVIKRIALVIPLAFAILVAAMGYLAHAALTACYPDDLLQSKPLSHSLQDEGEYYPQFDVTIQDKTGRIVVSTAGNFSHGNFYLDDRRVSIRIDHAYYDESLLDPYSATDFFEVERLVVEVDEQASISLRNLRITEIKKGGLTNHYYLHHPDDTSFCIVGRLEETPIPSSIAITSITKWLTENPLFAPYFVAFCPSIGVILAFGKNQDNRSECYISERESWGWWERCDLRHATNFHVVESRKRSRRRLIANPSEKGYDKLTRDYPDPRVYTLYVYFPTNESSVSINGLPTENIDHTALATQICAYVQETLSNLPRELISIISLYLLKMRSNK